MITVDFTVGWEAVVQEQEKRVDRQRGWILRGLGVVNQ
jgi:hypothetical protein